MNKSLSFCKNRSTLHFKTCLLYTYSLKFLQRIIATFNRCLYAETLCFTIPYASRMSVTYSASSNAYGTSADFECQTGYALLGASSAVCDRLNDQSMYGFWNYDSGTGAPTCQRKRVCFTGFGRVYRPVAVLIIIL